MISRVVTCNICHRTELTDREILPDEWIVEWDTGYVFCDDCHKGFEGRYGELNYLVKGKDKELTLFEMMEYDEVQGSKEQKTATQEDDTESSQD